MKLKQERIILFLLSIVITMYTIISFSNLGTNNFPQTAEQFSLEDEIVIDLNKITQLSNISICNGYNILNYDISYSEDGENFLPFSTINTEYFYSWETLPMSVKAQKIKITFKQYEELPPAYTKKIYNGNMAYINEIGVFNEKNELININTKYKNLIDEQNTVPLKKTSINSLYFDEFYFAKAGYQYANGIIDGEIDQPPLGKELISLGISIFGMTPFGWRFPGTLAGIFMIGFMFLLVKELFKSSKYGLLAATLLALDFMHFTQTRIATIDSFAVLSIMICFYAAFKMLRTNTYLRYTFLSGIMLGVGCAIKIYCAYAIPILGLMVLYKLLTIYKNSVFDAIQYLFGCILSFIFIPIVINILSFIPHFVVLDINDPIAYVINFYKEMFVFHTNSSLTHAFSSEWWQWLFNYKPMLYYGTQHNDIYSIIACFNNPLISIIGICSLIYTGYNALKEKEDNAILIIGCFLTFLIPWIFIERTVFIYHYFPASIFMIVSIIYMLSKLSTKINKKAYYIMIFTLINISTVLFLIYYPVLTGNEFNLDYARNFMIFYPFLNF